MTGKTAAFNRRRPARARCRTGCRGLCEPAGVKRRGAGAQPDGVDRDMTLTYLRSASRR
jgi:hypothetical protein